MKVPKILQFHVVTLTTLLLFLTIFSPSVSADDLDLESDSDSASEEVKVLSNGKFNPENMKGVEDSEKGAQEKSDMAQLMKDAMLKSIVGKRRIPSEDKRNSTERLLRQKEMLKKFKSQSEIKSEDSSNLRNGNSDFFDIFWWCAHTYYNSPNDCSCNHKYSGHPDCYGYDPPMMCPLADDCMGECICVAYYDYGYDFYCSS